MVARDLARGAGRAGSVGTLQREGCPCVANPMGWAIVVPLLWGAAMRQEYHNGMLASEMISDHSQIARLKYKKYKINS